MNSYVKKIIDRYTQSGTKQPSPENFHQWLAEDSFSAEKEEALRRLWNEPGEAPVEKTNAGWERFKQARRFNREKQAYRLTVWKYAAAIVLIVSLAGSYVFSPRTPQETSLAEYFTGYGQSETVVLPDGSEVLTNSGTLLVYPADFGRQTRTLYLSGEANFKVKKNPELPFIVKSKHLEIMALGTEFTVSAYAEDSYAVTTLINGSIEVTTVSDGVARVLSPGEQLAFHKQRQTASVQQVDIDEATAWQRGDLIFRGATIPDILNVLERKYDVSFQYKTATMFDDKFNFYFKKETPFADIMEIINTVAGQFEYQITYNK